MADAGDCLVCFQPVSTDGKCMVCVECKSLYHLGSCAGIKESTYTTMGATKRAKWRCRTCRSADSSSVLGSLSEEAQSDSAAESHFSALNAKLDLLLSMQASVDTLLTLPAKVDELLTLKPVVQNLQEKVKKVQDTVDELSAKYNSVLQKATENEEKAEQVQAQLTGVAATVDEHERTIQQLRGDLNHMEQRGRSMNLEISGLSHSKDENLKHVIADLGVKLGLPPLLDTDVLAAHRLPSKHDVVPGILIRFSSQIVCDAWMGCRGKLKALSRSTDDTKIFFNENLTRTNRELFWMARTKAKEAHFKFVWVKGGKIFAKKGEGSPLIRVNSVTDVNNIR